jgi:hypothetical protein
MIMASRIEHESSSMELDGLVQVRQDTLLLKSVPKAVGKVA